MNPTYPEWKYLSWFGYSSDQSFPWIYHENLGWIYLYSPTGKEAWFYFPNLGWLWSSEEIWAEAEENDFLWLYNSETGSWVAYWLSQSTQTVFWDDATGSFFSY